MDNKQPKAAKADEIELRPDGWKRFEHAVDAALKGAPRHRPPKSGVVEKRKS